MKIGIIKKIDGFYVIEVDEVGYTEDGLDYKSTNNIEINQDDITNFDITDESIESSYYFKEEWYQIMCEDYHYARLIKPV